MFRPSAHWQGHRFHRIIQQQEAGIQHEEHIHQTEIPDGVRVPVLPWAEAVDQTQHHLTAGITSIIGATLEATTQIANRSVILHGKVDRIDRSDDEPYTLIEIKQRQSPGEADVYQVDLYIWLFKQQYGIEPAAQIRLGSTPTVVEHEYDEDRLMSVLDRLVNLMVTSNSPLIHLKSHCQSYHWHTFCKQTAAQKRNLSLLNDICSDAIQHMRTENMHNLHQLVELDATELKQFKGIGDVRAVRFHAQARAWIENVPIRLADAPDVCQREAFYFDIETDPYSGEVWSIGYSDGVGDVNIILVLPQHEAGLMTLSNGQSLQIVPDHLSAWAHFAHAVQQKAQPIFHWTPFDVSNMKQFVPHIHGRLQSQLHDLNQIVKQTAQLPVKGTSLKTIATYLGCEWSGYDTWEQAWTDYRRWLNFTSKPEKFLINACQYQVDDVLAMHVVRDWIIADTLTS